ncbi:MAG: preprotein translocase subunit SecA [Candidatus Acetothermia bacterium]|jgi:preprotein translocase subunit SecA|nr:preprotein translocase subunit SecA [Candidatus Acetothermia bacterium]MDH7505840.1 preprotein translocase subunit SecA [Candidatus Acetothermia bacterium]
MALPFLKHAVEWLFGETNEQKLRRLQPYLEAVNALGPKIKGLSDAELAAKTPEFRARLAAGETLDDLLPEAFAVVREVADRQVEMRPFDVQVLGAVVLHQRRIAEMRTGEGKTLVATMPAYLNALAGKVHIVTVNDYLAKRDRYWMGPIYEFLGLKVGLLQEGLEIPERKAAYQCDIIYGTNNQFGFDYLRDNLAVSVEQQVQTALDYAIIDEVDNILIDEARTPLIISGSTEESARLYKKFASLAPLFKEGQDFETDEKVKSVVLTEAGVRKAEELLHQDNIYSPENIELLHHLEVALRARLFFHKDVDYIVKDGRVIIVDEFTGRLMPDRRYSDGLHQALEAKEGLEIRRETQTLAQITLQHYFRLYKGIAGMTGTAKTEEDEFKEIYGMDVVVIPTHKPMIRTDAADILFRTEEGKFKAIVDEVERLHKEGRPVLIGTNSIERSERLSALMKRRGLKHNVLNAKYHEKEAEIIKDAGQRGAITVATNMAGRGVDIKLGEGVAALGGLHIIGAQRHESRRIDDQLRGRAGRQGDPGSSQFFISLEDELIKLFGGERIGAIMDRLGMEEGQAITHELLTRAVRRAQKRVEERNFEIRKRLLQYDQIMARQREVIYSLRSRFLLGREADEQELEEYLRGILEEHAAGLVERFLPERGEWDLAGLGRALAEFQNAPFDPAQLSLDSRRREDYQQIIEQFLLENYRAQAARLGEHFPEVSRYMILNIIDENWRRHLWELDELREGIGWRGYAGRDPLVEFTREAFLLFQEMLARCQEQIISYLFKPRLELRERREGAPRPLSRRERRLAQRFKTKQDKPARKAKRK